jgi:hypothetical protein
MNVSSISGESVKSSGVTWRQRQRWRHGVTAWRTSGGMASAASCGISAAA